MALLIFFCLSHQSIGMQWTLHGSKFTQTHSGQLASDPCIALLGLSLGQVRPPYYRCKPYYRCRANRLSIGAGEYQRSARNVISLENLNSKGKSRKLVDIYCKTYYLIIFQSEQKISKECHAMYSPFMGHP